MAKPAAKFAIGQAVVLTSQPTTRNARIENVVGRIRREWMYQVSYQIVDEITPKGSKRYSQPFFEPEITLAPAVSRQPARAAGQQTGTR
jgi:hypothetical protein